MNKDFHEFAMNADERAELAEIYAANSNGWENDTITITGSIDSDEYVSVEENMQYRAMKEDEKLARDNLIQSRDYQFLRTLLPEPQCEDVCNKALLERVSIAEALRRIVQRSKDYGLLKI